MTHDVKRFIVERPVNYSFIEGQAAKISINKDKLRDEKRPFTSTSMNKDGFLEFTIKIYTDRKGITHKMNSLKI